MDKKVILSWSSGKDSYLALQTLLKQGFEIVALVCVLRDDERVSVHGIRRTLLQQQASSLGIPLHEINLQKEDRYETEVAKALKEWKDKGINQIAFGDLFLEDIRTWRNNFHKKLGFECLYPIWKKEPKTLAQNLIEDGTKLRLTCVNLKHLDLSFAGRLFDESLLNDLPENVDHCGENGEFHTFVFDGSLFKSPIDFEISEPVIRKFEDPGHHFSFGFCDLIPIH